MRALVGAPALVAGSGNDRRRSALPAPSLGRHCAGLADGCGCGAGTRPCVAPRAAARANIAAAPPALNSFNPAIGLVLAGSYGWLSVTWPATASGLP